MTKRRRTILFFLLVMVFFLSAPTVILYSQGYRIDIDQKRITQTGAFYLKVKPNSVHVRINGEDVKKTNFLFGSTLTKNFLPRAYTVEISREGYHTWQKTLEIRARQVTDAKHVILFPKDIEFGEITENIKNIELKELSPDERKMAFAKESELWISYIQDSGAQPFYKADEEIFLTRFSQNIEHINWIGSHYLVFSVGEQIKIAEIDDRDTLNIIDIVQFPSSQVSDNDSADLTSRKLFYNSSSQTLFVLSNGIYYESDKLIR